MFIGRTLLLELLTVTETLMTQMQNSLLYSKAYWVTESLIAWNVDVANAFSCHLIASKNASLTVANCQIQGLDFWQFLLLVQTCGR